MSNDGFPIYPTFLGSVCMGHLSTIVLVLSISVWFSVGSRCRCLRNRLAEALRWRRVLPPCLSCSMNQMNQQGGQSCAARDVCLWDSGSEVSRNKWPCCSSFFDRLALVLKHGAHGNGNLEWFSFSAIKIWAKLLYIYCMFVVFLVDCDYLWTLEKLQTEFPYYEREMLEDIIKQCNGSYNHAYALLNV